MFQDIEQPTTELKPQNGVASAATDLMQLFGDQTPEPDEKQEAEAPEPLGAQPEAEVDGEQAESPEQPEAESRQEQQRTFKIHVNGEEREFTEKELTEGFLRQQDYTSKTTELAQERERIQAEAQAILQQRQQYDEKLAQMDAEYEALIPDQFKNMNWENLAVTNPEMYKQYKPAYDNLMAQRKKVQEERERIANENQQAWQQQQAQYLQSQKQALLSKRPELSDQEKLKEYFTEIGKYATHSYGFHPQELAAVGDHRLFDIAYKAMKYDELQSQAEGKQESKKQIPQLKGGERPEDSPTSKKLRDARAKLAKTGSHKDAAKAFGAMFGSG